MKPVTIDHPFRTMTLGTVDDTPLRPVELEAIEKYTALHNVSWELKQLLNRLIDDYSTVMESRQQCQQAFDNLQNEYVLLAPMLHYYEEGHYLPEEEVEDVNEDERVCYDTTALLIQLDEFKIQYYQYAEKVMAIEKEHGNMQRVQEQLDTTLEDFDDNYFSPIVRDYKIAIIDIVALDQDFDDYKGDLAQVTQLSDRMYDTREAFIELHNQLYKGMQELDKDLAKLFSLLKKMNGEDDDRTN